jgi:protoheme IX farnesyltransferase
VKQTSFGIALSLIKLYLSLAVTLSAVTGYFLSGNKAGIDLLIVAAGVFFLASGSAVLNQYTERSTDKLMERTRNRPIASGLVLPRTAIIFVLGLFLTGAALLWFSGLRSLILGILTVIMYNVVYTGLKRKSALAVIPGALVGALPPLIGYFGSGIISLNHDIIVFSVFMFLWQLPHFWLILVKYEKEYNKAGFPTLYSIMNERALLILTFTWVLLSSGFLVIAGIASFEGLIRYLLAGFNVLFIWLFYRILFISKRTVAAFILINTFTLLLMIFLIAFSLCK